MHSLEKESRHLTNLEYQNYIYRTVVMCDIGGVLAIHKALRFEIDTLLYLGLMMKRQSTYSTSSMFSCWYV